MLTGLELTFMGVTVLLSSFQHSRFSRLTCGKKRKGGSKKKRREGGKKGIEKERKEESRNKERSEAR